MLQFVAEIIVAVMQCAPTICVETVYAVVLAVMFPYFSQAKLVFQQHELHAMAMKIGKEGIVLSLDYPALRTIRNGNGGDQHDADVLVMLGSTCSPTRQLDGCLLQGKTTHAHWADVGRYSMLIRFSGLSPVQTSQLDSELAELVERDDVADCG